MSNYLFMVSVTNFLCTIAVIFVLGLLWFFPILPIFLILGVLNLFVTFGFLILVIQSKRREYLGMPIWGCIITIVTLGVGIFVAPNGLKTELFKDRKMEIAEEMRVSQARNETQHVIEKPPKTQSVSDGEISKKTGVGSMLAKIPVIGRMFSSKDTSLISSVGQNQMSNLTPTPASSSPSETAVKQSPSNPPSPEVLQGISKFSTDGTKVDGNQTFETLPDPFRVAAKTVEPQQSPLTDSKKEPIIREGDVPLREIKTDARVSQEWQIRYQELTKNADEKNLSEVWKEVNELRVSIPTEIDATVQRYLHAQLDNFILRVLDNHTRPFLIKAEESFAKENYERTIENCETVLKSYRAASVPTLVTVTNIETPVYQRALMLYNQAHARHRLLENPQERFFVRGFFTISGKASVQLEDVLTREKRFVKVGERFGDFTVEKIEQGAGIVTLRRGVERFEIHK